MIKKILKKVMVIASIGILAILLFSNSYKSVNASESTDNDTTSSGYTFTDDSADTQTGTNWRLTENGTLYTTQATINSNYMDNLYDYLDSIKNIVITANKVQISANMYDCLNLEGVYIDSDYTSISANAFWTCEKLKTVYIKHLDVLAGDASSQTGAFCECNALSSFKIDGLADNFTIGAYAFYQAGKNSSTGFDLELSGSKITFAQNSFEQSKIKSLKVNAETVNINAGSFYCCTSLTNVYFSHLDSLGGGSSTADSIFCSCPLTSVVIDNLADDFTFGKYSFYEAGNTTTGFDLKLTGNKITFAANSFENAYVSNLTIDATSVTTTQNAFEVSKIEEFIVNSEYTSLAKATFYDCEQLKTVYISHLDVLEGGSSTTGVFTSCYALSSLTIDCLANDFTFGKYAFYQAGSKGTTGFDLKINGGTVTFDASSFEQSKIKSLSVDSDHAIINSGAFYCCTSLTDVYFSHLDSIADVSSTAAAVFGCCSSLTSVKIDFAGKGGTYNCITGEGNTFRIGNYAFYEAGSSSGCDFYINGNEITIGKNALDFSKMSNITIDASRIITEAYSIQRSSVKEIYFNSDYTSIATATFYDCEKLNSIYIKHLDIIASASNSNNGAFTSCYALSSLTIDGLADDFTFGNYAFYQAGSKSSSGFDLEIVGKTITFGTSSFEQSKIKSVSVYADQVNLKVGVFYCCTSLTNVYFSHLDSLQASTSVGSAIFCSCPISTFIVDELASDFTFTKYSFYEAGNKSTGFEMNVVGEKITFASNSFERSYLKTLDVNGTNVNLQGYAFGVSQKLNFVHFNRLDTMASSSSTSGSIFYCCSALNTFVVDALADDFTFGNYAFSDLANLKYVDITGKNITIGNSCFKSAKVNSIKIKAESLTLKPYAFDSYKAKATYVFDVDSLSGYANGLGGTYTFKVYLKESMTDYDTISQALTSSGHTVSVYDPTDTSLDVYKEETSSVVYTRKGSNKYYTLKEITDKTLTTFTINENCKEILAGVFDGLTSLTYTEYENGLYIGTSTNPYYALIKANGDITLHENLVIIADDAFAGLTSVKVTIPEDISPIDTTKFSGASKVELVIPDGWATLTTNASGTKVLKNISSATNLTYDITNFSNIMSLTLEEFNSLINSSTAEASIMVAESNSNNSTVNVKIVNYAKKGSDEEEVLHVGELLEGVVEGYTGTLFYVWKVGDNLDYRIYSSADTISQFKGTSFNKDQKYYTTNFIATMSYDNIPENAIISLDVYQLQSSGLKLIGSATNTLNTASLTETIPDSTKLKLLKGEYKTYDSILTDFGLLHANKCLKITSMSIAEGVGVVSLKSRKINCLAYGSAVINYTVTSDECYCHGAADSAVDKILYITVIDTKTFDAENNYIETTLSPTSYEYDGQDKTPTLSVYDAYNKKTLTLGVDYEIDSTSVTTAKNVDTYSIIVNGIGEYSGTRTLTWTITKKLNNADVTIDGWTYGDTSNDPSVTNNECTSTPVFTYKVKGDGDDTYTDVVPTNAGTYILKTVIAGDENYEEFTKEVEFVISPKSITVTIDNKESIYGDTIVDLTAVCNDIVSGDNAADIYTLSTTATSTSNVGDYAIVGTQLNTCTNYNVTFTNGTYRVTQKEVEIDWCLDDYTYNGSIQTVTATYKDINNDDISLTVVIDKEFKNVAIDYLATATLTDTNYKLPSVNTKTYTIKPKEVEIDWCLDDYTYNGEVQTVTATYKDINNEDVSLTVVIDKEFKNAANDYTATASLSDTNYKLPSVNTKTYTIKPKPLTDDSIFSSLDFISNVYDGTLMTNTVVIKDGDVTLVLDTDYEITSGTTGTNVGTYNLVVEGKGNYCDTLSLEWKITKKPNNADVTILGWTYGDTPNNPNVTGNESTSTPVFTYKVKDAGDETYTEDVPTNAGTYILKMYIPEDDNYEEFTKEIEFVISPKSIIVTIDSKTSVYGDDIVELTAVCNDIVSGDNTSDIYTLSTTATSTSNVGDYTIVGSQISTCTNYSVSFNDGTYTIEVKLIEITIDSKSSIYGADIVELTASTEDIVNGDNASDIYTLSTTATSTSNVGEYDITGTKLSTCTNYNVSFTNAIYTINPKPLTDNTITSVLGFKSKVFDGTLMTNSVEIKDGDVTLVLDTDYEIKSGSTGTNVGTYNLVVEGKGNYCDTLSLEWKITKKPNNADVTILGWTYGDTPNNPNVTGNESTSTPVFTYKVKDAGDDTYTEDVPTNAGTYILKMYIPEDDNYEEFTKEIEFVISPKAITVTIDNKESIYGDDIVELTAVCNEILAGDNIADIYALSTTATSTSNVGEYAIVGSQISTCTNYNVTFTNGTYKVMQREVEIDWCLDDYTYDGEVQSVTASYKDINNDDISLTVSVDKEFKNAATNYIATATLTDTNYKLPSVNTKTYTINPKPLTDNTISKELEFTSKVFNNTLITNGVVIKDGDVTLVLDTDYEIKSGSTGTNVGTYTLVVEGKGNYCDTLNLEWKITKKPNNADVTILGWTYGDTPNNPNVTGNESTSTRVFTYKVKDAGDDTYTSNVPTNAGTYILKTLIPSDDIYDEFTKEVEFVISPKAITVTIDNKESTYGDTILELTARCNDIVSGDNDSDIYTLSTTATSTSNVGEYAIAGTQLNTCTNYNVTFTNGTYSVTQKEVVIDWCLDDYTYNGEIQTVTATYKDINNKDVSLTVSVDKEFKKAATDYIATATLTDTNYKLPSVNTKTYTIKPKNIVVRIDNKSSLYGKELALLTASCDSIVSGDKDSDIYTLSTTATSTSNVGKYIIKGDVLDTCTNYNVKFVNGIYEISNTNINTDETATIDITIKDKDDNPVINAKVELIYLERVIQSGETDESGVIEFTNILYGNYSIVVTYNSTMLTHAIDVFESIVNDTVKLPSKGFNTVLKGDAATSSDNLENAISPEEKVSNDDITITMNANYSSNETTKDLILSYAKNDDSGINLVDYIDVNIDKNGNIIKTTYGYQNVVFEISGLIANSINSFGEDKYEYLIVYREHDGVVRRLNKVSYDDGINANYECYFIKNVNDHYYITIHVNNFSTYAFGVSSSIVSYFEPSDNSGFTNPLKCFIHWITLLVTIIFTLFELFVLLFTASKYHETEETKEYKGEDAKKALENKDDSAEVVTTKINKEEENSEEVLEKVESTETTKVINRHRPLWWINLFVIIIFAVLSVLLFLKGFCVICLILMIIDIILAIFALLLLFRNFIINHLKDSKNVVINKFVKYLQKIDDSVSLKDAINLVPVLPVALFDEINKKTIADYVDTLDNTKTNRKADFVKGTKLYLADTHYITYKNQKGKQKTKCFVYVYQDLEHKKVFLLVKLTMEELEEFIKEHRLCATSRFPIGFEWTFVGIDETFKFSDVESLIKLTIDFVSNDSKKQNQEEDKTSKAQNAYMSSIKDTDGNLIDEDKEEK